MSTLDDLIDEQNVIRNELAALDDNPDTTEEDHGDLRDTLIKRWKDIEKRKEPLITRMEDLQLIKRAAADPGNREPADPGATPWRGGSGPQVMMRHDPFAGREETQEYALLPRADVIARAQNTIEDSHKRGVISSAAGEEATRKSQHPGIARHMLLYGADDYVDAFRAYLANPEMVSRAAMALATASGGVMLPYQLDPTIVLTNDGSANPYRRLGNVIPTTTNVYHGVSSAGVNAAWLNEATSASDASPGFGAITVYPKKAAAWVYGSFEIASDTNVGEQLPRLLSDAKDRLEEAAFAAGTGGNTDNTGQPAGVAAALGTATRNIATSTTGGAFFAGTAGQADVYGLQAKLAPRWRASQSCAWVMNLTNINKVRSIDQYGGGAFWANLNMGSPASGLLGSRVEESTSITVSTGTGATTAYAAAVYGDWSQFYIVDRIGTQMLYEPLIKSTATIAAPTGQQGWFMFWRVGSAVANASSFAWQLNGTA